MQQWQQKLTNEGKPPKLGDRWIVGATPLSGVPDFANRAAQAGDAIYYATTYTNSGTSSPVEQWVNSGQPASTDSQTLAAPVHRYVGQVGDTSTSGQGAFVWASSLSAFHQQNSPKSCPALNSADPCGILKGSYSDETVGGTYSYYGQGENNGVWGAASGPLLRAAFDGGRPNQRAYPSNLADWMMQERHFAQTPPNVIFITSEVVGFKPDPCAGCTVNENVEMVTFTDTGIPGNAFDHPYWWGGGGDQNKVSNPYFSQQSSKLTKPYKSAFYYYSDDPFQYLCVPLWKRNPDLPSSQYNGSFYSGYAMRGMDQNGSAMTYPKSQSNCNKAQVGPGFTTNQSGAANNPQFRMPVLYVGATTAGQDTVSCQQYRGDLGTMITPVKFSGVAQTYSMCGDDLATWLDAQLGELDGPTAVTQPRAKKVKKHKATVSWKAPKKSGHGKIIKYQTRIKGPGKGEAKCRKSRGGCWTKWRTTDSKPGDHKLKHVHRKLKAGKVYRVQLRAVTTVGPGKVKTVKFRTKRGGIPTRPGNG